MEPSNPINQLIIAIIAGGQAGDLMQRLRGEGFYFTQIDSSGGLLQEPSACLLIGLNRERLEALLGIIRTCCHTRRMFIPARMDVSQLQGQPVMIEAEVGGAVIFSFEVERFHQL